MNKRGLLATNYIVFLIAFILISSFLLIILDTESIGDNGVTGNVIRSSCVDSDGGRNINVAGTVTKSRVIKRDSCSGNLKVKEWYCENNNYKYKILNCPSNKKCSKGACL